MSINRHRFGMRRLGLSLWLCASPGCDPGAPARDDDLQQQAGLAKDGTRSIAAPRVVLNRYAALGADAHQGDTTLALSMLPGLGVDALLPLFPNDLLLVIQMQGADVDASNTVGYGQVTDLRSAGSYEFIPVAAVDAATGRLTVNSGCSGLRNSYQAAGHVQIIRVPQYDNLSVDATGSVTAKPWDGQTGGVVALQLRDTLMLNGAVDVSGLGFRGGTKGSLTAGRLANVGSYYLSRSLQDGGNRGEGIAGGPLEYAHTGPYGRGAAANGGGGGNRIAAGGGGGANGGSTGDWNGQGEMPLSAVGGPLAWLLDPGYDARRSTFAGGGRGGYSLSAGALDPTAMGPAATLWGGDFRRERGGLGGRPVPNDPRALLFLGGGGGAGDDFQGKSGSGGTGGGLLFIDARRIAGSGQLLANGQDGGNAVSNTAGAGGGGAGGTIVLAAFVDDELLVQANGGNGGDQQEATPVAAGPGGGGGGGYLALAPSRLPVRQANPGTGGNTASPAMTLFPRNGASDGGIGLIVESAAGPYGGAPFCSVADVALSLTATPGAASGVSPFVLRVSVQNSGPSLAGHLAVRLDLPEQLRITSLVAEQWDCQIHTGHLDCTLARLNASAAAGFAVTARPPLQLPTLEFRAAVTTETMDPDPTNNSASLTVNNAGPGTAHFGGGGLGCSLATASERTGDSVAMGLFLALSIFLAGRQGARWRRQGD